MKILTSRRSWLVKYLLLIPIMCMVLNLRSSNDNMLQLESQVTLLQNKTDNLIQRVNNNKIIITNPTNPTNPTTTIPSTTPIPTTVITTIQVNNSEEIQLRKLIDNSNRVQLIRNRHFIHQLILQEQQLYPIANHSSTNQYPAPKFLVLLIQIHSRFTYLKALVDSLRNTRHINETLVIFSHDVYNPEMNDFIAGISFCATLQLFYPFSIQAYPNQFPGKDPNDCDKGMSKQQAIRAKCNNAYSYDSYGHYREHDIVQIKHHWFWKLGFVFEQLNVTKGMRNLQILLLEEDYYLMPDAIHVLRKLAQKQLSDIDVVSLAHIQKLVQDLEFNKLSLYAKAIWHTSHHNTGIMLGRKQWDMLTNCINAFCTYDDYNWDWTLQYVSQTCFKLPLVSIYPSSSRVIHIGQCGTHYKGKNCDPKQSVEALKLAYAKKQSKFFSEEFEFEKVDTSIKQPKKPNGGWSDPRDHMMCKRFMQDAFNLQNITLV